MAGAGLGRTPIEEPELKGLRTLEFKEFPRPFKALIECAWEAFGDSDKEHLKQRLFLDWLCALEPFTHEDRSQRIKIFLSNIERPEDFPRAKAAFELFIKKRPPLKTDPNKALGIFIASKEKKQVEYGLTVEDCAVIDMEVEVAFLSWLQKTTPPLSPEIYELRFLDFLNIQAEENSVKELHEAICYAQGVTYAQTVRDKKIPPDFQVIIKAKHSLKSVESEISCKMQALIDFAEGKETKESVDTILRTAENALAPLKKQAPAELKYLCKFAQGMKEARYSEPPLKPYRFLTYSNKQPWQDFKFPDGEFTLRKVKMLHQIGMLFRIGNALQYANLNNALQKLEDEARAVEHEEKSNEQINTQEVGQKQALYTQLRAAKDFLLAQQAITDGLANRVIQAEEKQAITTTPDLPTSRGMFLVTNFNDLLGTTDEKSGETLGLLGEEIKHEIEEANSLRADSPMIRNKIKQLRQYRADREALLGRLEFKKPDLSKEAETKIPLQKTDREIDADLATIESKLREIKENQEAWELKLNEFELAQQLLLTNELKQPSEFLTIIRRLIPLRNELQIINPVAACEKEIQDVIDKQFFGRTSECWTPVKKAVEDLKLGSLQRDIERIEFLLKDTKQHLDVLRENLKQQECHLNDQKRTLKEFKQVRANAIEYDKKYNAAVLSKYRERQLKISNQTQKRYHQLDELNRIIERLDSDVNPKRERHEALAQAAGSPLRNSFPALSFPPPEVKIQMSLQQQDINPPNKYAWLGFAGGLLVSGGIAGALAIPTGFMSLLIWGVGVAAFAIGSAIGNLCKGDDANPPAPPATPQTPTRPIQIPGSPFARRQNSPLSAPRPLLQETKEDTAISALKQEIEANFSDLQRTNHTTLCALLVSPFAKYNQGLFLEAFNQIPNLLFSNLTNREAIYKKQMDLKLNLLKLHLLTNVLKLTEPLLRERSKEFILRNDFREAAKVLEVNELERFPTSKDLRLGIIRDLEKGFEFQASPKNGSRAVAAQDASRYSLVARGQI